MVQIRVWYIPYTYGKNTHGLQRTLKTQTFVHSTVAKKLAMGFLPVIYKRV